MDDKALMGNGWSDSVGEAEYSVDGSANAGTGTRPARNTPPPLKPRNRGRRAVEACLGFEAQATIIGVATVVFVTLLSSKTLKM